MTKKNFPAKTVPGLCVYPAPKGQREESPNLGLWFLGTIPMGEASLAHYYLHGYFQTPWNESGWAALIETYLNNPWQKVLRVEEYEFGLTINILDRRPLEDIVEDLQNMARILDRSIGHLAVAGLVQRPPMAWIGQPHGNNGLYVLDYRMIDEDECEVLYYIRWPVGLGRAYQDLSDCILYVFDYQTDRIMNREDLISLKQGMVFKTMMDKPVKDPPGLARARAKSITLQMRQIESARLTSAHETQIDMEAWLKAVHMPFFGGEK